MRASDRWCKVWQDMRLRREFDVWPTSIDLPVYLSDRDTAAGDLLRNAPRDGAQRHMHAALSLAHGHLKGRDAEAASADFSAMDGARVSFIGDSCVALAQHSACLPQTVLAEHVENSLLALQVRQ